MPNTHSVFRADIVFVTEMKTGFISKSIWRGGGGVRDKESTFILHIGFLSHFELDLCFQPIALILFGHTAVDWP